jgi:hypothetical protein
MMGWIWTIVFEILFDYLQSGLRGFTHTAAKQQNKRDEEARNPIKKKIQ